MSIARFDYADGTSEVLQATSALSLIKRYDLATAKHVGTKIVQLAA